MTALHGHGVSNQGTYPLEPQCGSTQPTASVRAVEHPTKSQGVTRANRRRCCCCCCCCCCCTRIAASTEHHRPLHWCPEVSVQGVVHFADQGNQSRWHRCLAKSALTCRPIHRTVGQLRAKQACKSQCTKVVATSAAETAAAFTNQVRTIQFAPPGSGRKPSFRNMPRDASFHREM
jgi:hypothetical protein